ncbi:CACTA en-spm transposon protein [Cucumis melo var. makuwa]|uniref:CACTA en-spm transposon protein n=1 Tax=Cucumis melo var. makuwa TaxID=1194695 RepID=A0A5D3BD73_CUCMM|nr:CACTA en-spm transposon protein [Cucumis melo var. makuwa]
MFRFWFAEEHVILATQAHQVFYLDDPKNGSNRKVIQVVQNKRIWDVSEVDDVENEDLKCTMSFPHTNFLKTDAMFLEFADNLDNLVGGLSSVGDNFAWSSFQPSTTPTLRRRAQCRLSELECYVAANGRISMTIALGTEKPISPYVVRFSHAIGVFLCLISIIKQCMLTTCKEFQGDCHRHFKKYNDPEEARANPPHLLNSCPSLPQRVIIHSLGMRYARRCWVDDWLLKRPWLETQAEGCKTRSASSSTTSCPQSTVELQLQAKLDQAMQQIE